MCDKENCIQRHGRGVLVKTLSAHQTAQDSKFRLPIRWCLLAIAMLLVIASSVCADISWVHPAGQTGDWFVPSNWGGRLPNSSEYVYINNGGTASISNPGAVSGHLGVGSGMPNGNCVLSASGVLTTSYSAVWGTFSHTGGAHTTLGLAAYGTYSLSGTGIVNAEVEDVGAYNNTGLFQQTGGTNTVGCLTIDSGDRYQLTGGVLQPNGILNKGVFDGGNSPATITSANCIIDFSAGEWQNLGSTSLNLGTNTLSIVPTGFDPRTHFAAGGYSNLGMIHTVGTTLVVAAGQGFGGLGSINDLVDCQGNIGASSNSIRGIDLNKGLTLSGSGAIDLGRGQLTVNDAVSGMSGGSLTALTQYIGYKGTGSFNQTGGINSPFVLEVGGYAGNGTYNLSGSGQLSCTGLDVGESYNSVGNFVATGGANTSTRLRLGVSGIGTYSQDGSAVLVTDGEEIGVEGTGTFTQSSGTNTTNALTIAGYAGSYGTYNLNGGTLTTQSLTGGSGTAAFNFGGGTLKAGKDFSTSLPMALTGIGGDATMDTAGSMITLSGQLSGPGGLNKIGSGTVRLSAQNIYNGPTTVNAGLLYVTGTLANNGSDKVLIHADATGATKLTRHVLGAGLPSYAGLGSTIAGGALNTKADIKAGAASGAADVSMGWRTRNHVSGGNSLISEVLSLDGIRVNGSGTDTFLLQMSYDPAIYGLPEAEAIAKQSLYLVTLNGSEWIRAVDGNFSGTAAWQGDMPVSAVASGNLATELGWYGVDTSTHVAWAVLNHNSYFAIVPEPSGFVLLGMGAVGLLAWFWRRGKRR
jgi:autotransporter-associated beta strand protein